MIRYTRRSLLRLAALVAAVALVPARLAAQAGLPDAPGARCEETGTWSAPTPLRLPSGRPVFIEPGSAELHPDGALALGTPLTIWLHDDDVLPPESEWSNLDTAHVRWAFTRSGFVARPDGEVEPLGLPAAGADSGMLYASIRRDRAGAYHVVWAEDITGGYEPDRLWYARLDAAAAGDGARMQWSSPVRIADGATFRWHGQLTNQLAARGDSLVLAATARDSAGSHVLVALGTGSAWRTARYRDEWGISYVAAGLSARGMPLLIMAGYVDERRGLFATELASWDDAGGSWHTPVPLDTLPGVSVGEIRLAHLGDDSLLVVWEHRAADGLSTLGLRTMVSPDGGTEWRAAGELPLAGGLSGLRLLVDHRGGVHAIYVGSPGRNVLGQPGAVQHARWRDGRWIAGAPASPRPSFSNPLAAATPDGIMAIWGEGRMLPDRIIPRSYAAWWRDGCASLP